LVIDPQAARLSFTDLNEARALIRAAVFAQNGGVGAPPPRLTPRQLDVVGLLANGRTKKQVAVELRVSLRTVDGHISSIRRRLCAQTREQMVALAVALWLVEVEPAREG